MPREAPYQTQEYKKKQPLDFQAQFSMVPSYSQPKGAFYPARKYNS